MDFTVNISHSPGWTEGRRIVDLHELARQMHCKRCKTILDLNRTINETLFGLASVLYIICLCGELNEVHTGKKQSADGKHHTYDINTKASISLMVCGAGAQNVSSFLQAILEIPVPAEDASPFHPFSSDISAASSVSGLPVPMGVTLTYTTAVSTNTPMPVPVQLLQVPHSHIQLQVNHQEDQQQVNPVSSKSQQVLIISQHKETSPQLQHIVYRDCILCPPCPHNKLNVPADSDGCNPPVRVHTVVNKGSSASRETTVSSKKQQPSNKKDLATTTSKRNPTTTFKTKLTKDERDDLKVNTKCTVCRILFRSREHFRMHRILHPQIVKKKKKKRIRCSQCKAKFDNQKTLLGHMTAAHSVVEHQCDICDKTFRTRAVLNQHVKRTHLKGSTYVCHICEKKVLIKLQLREHLNAHTEDKPWSCSECEKSFRSKLSLNIHMRSHAGSTKHQCRNCGELFPQKSDLDCHLEEKHAADHQSLNIINDARMVKAFNYATGTTPQNDHLHMSTTEQTMAMTQETERCCWGSSTALSLL